MISIIILMKFVFPSYGFWVINFNFFRRKIVFVCGDFLTLLECFRRVCDDDDESVTGSHLWFRFKVFPKSFPYSKKTTHKINLVLIFLNSIVSTFFLRDVEILRLNQLISCRPFSCILRNLIYIIKIIVTSLIKYQMRPSIL